MIQEVAGGYVKSERHNRITTIEFFHPKSNSLPSRLLDELAQTIHRAGNDFETTVVVLRSGGDKAFSAGASFDELAAIETPEEGFAFFSGFASVINAMRKCPVFIVARVHGRCVGGGVGIAAAADYTMASEHAEVKLSELSVGIGPFVVGPCVERKMGVSAFAQLTIDAGMWRSAQWAGRKGLFAEVYPTIGAMDESIAKLITHLQQSSREAMHEIKKMFWAGTEHWDQLLSDRARISGRLVLTPESKAAIAKFRQKT
jgi:methylglutaconyl-CoA hydratase